MIDWRTVTGSTRIIAEAYLPEAETILVRFPSGKEYYYAACPPSTWDAFTAAGQSRGEYIADVLDNKPRGPWTG